MACLGTSGRSLTTDSFGQSIFLAILTGVGIVFWYFIRKRMEAPKKAAAPPSKAEPDSSITAPPRPPRAYSANSVLQRAERRGLWRIEPSYSPTVYSLVNIRVTVASKVPVTSDQDDLELDGPVYWDRMSPKQHVTFSLTSALSNSSGSLTVVWRDHERRYREATVIFPKQNTGGN